MKPMASGGVKPIPWDSNDKEIFTMLDEIILADKEKAFVKFNQHGGDDLKCTSSEN